ncbi:hypothetical protein CXF68_18340 [Tenacibaculum sp. Bg11-29]|uniref:hypothetical protein n=1 Tax=Tenacibaculum sp. Bg11-29 TaxID=2058306 RepID=UPI000C34C8D8|nr:hypothetical protein [Tenacibaculum sp. Bg11-29]PKH52536.1 hypothetical protein CXF68_18340 [Tenacibaculum sp. Bg11-29]
MDLKQVDLFPFSVSKLTIIPEIKEKGEFTFINKPFYGFQNETFIETTNPFTVINNIQKQLFLKKLQTINIYYKEIQKLNIQNKYSF